MVFLKLSIGASLLRLKLGRGMGWIVWGLVIISVLCNALVVIGSLFSCTPIDAIWDRSLDNFTCIPGKYVVGSSYGQTGTYSFCHGLHWPRSVTLSVSDSVNLVGNIVTDIFFSLSPLYYLRNVKVSAYNKWALRVLFLVGLSATACSIAKLQELPKLANTTDPTCMYRSVLVTTSTEYYSASSLTTIS